MVRTGKKQELNHFGICDAIQVSQAGDSGADR